MTGMGKSLSYIFAFAINANMHIAVCQRRTDVQTSLKMDAIITDDQIWIGSQRGCIQGGNKNISWCVFRIGDVIKGTFAEEGQHAASHQLLHDIFTGKAHQFTLSVLFILNLIVIKIRFNQNAVNHPSSSTDNLFHFTTGRRGKDPVRILLADNQRGANLDFIANLNERF